MTAQKQMKQLGEIHGRRYYWADGSFKEPGLYYWDGENNVLAYGIQPDGKTITKIEGIDANGEPLAKANAGGK